MKISKKIINEYLGVELTDQFIADSINFTVGAEVDEITLLPDSQVVVARIEEVLPHPNADKLQIARVFDSKETFLVVCGAPNIKAGMIVPLAKIGAKIQDFEISKTKIRGEDSFGMLCSEKELGLGEDQTGILSLDPSYQLGSPLNSYITSDTIFDLEITPNRGDLLSHYGIARELAAIKNIKLKKEPISLEMSGKPIHDSLDIELKTPGCPRYFARKFDNIKIAESPSWLKNALNSLGQKPINNVVDITNYIMLDLGQPLHAFDANKLSGQKIIVRNARNNEIILTLDGTERTLGSGDILITDQNGPIALAGVIGGKNSEIDCSTTSVVLESAEFDPVSIRKTAKSQNIISEAAYRFERGIDSQNLEYALNKASYLINQLAGEIGRAHV